MMKRISQMGLALIFAAMLVASPARANGTSPPVGATGTPIVLIPIACSFILPLLMSISLQRELSGEEVTSTTLICFTGPLGYYIATENGWIGPEFFQGGGS